MPQIKSAIKRVKTQAKANAKNASQLSALRTAIKKFKNAQAAGAENAPELLKSAISAIDKAETKGLIHANKANRDKSRLNQLANANK